MRALAVLALALGLLCGPSVASAAAVGFSFDATVVSADPSFHAPAGTSFSGSLSYEPATPEFYGNLYPDLGFYQTGSLTFTLAGVPYVLGFAGVSGITLQSDPGVGLFEFDYSFDVLAQLVYSFPNPVFPARLPNLDPLVLNDPSRLPYGDPRGQSVLFFADASNDQLTASLGAVHLLPESRATMLLSALALASLSLARRARGRPTAAH
jgi:hypothetical protein